MRRALSIAAAALVLVSLGAATTGYDGPEDQPHIMSGDDHDHNHTHEAPEVNESNIPDYPENNTIQEYEDLVTVQLFNGFLEFIGLK